MSGILDSKSRVLDVLLTAEGRKQAADGKLNVSYVTFTDAEVSYQKDAEEGHVDPTTKIYFEACSLPQDRIVFETDESGNLIVGEQNVTSLSNLASTSAAASIASPASIVNGKLIANRYVMGRRVRVFDTKQVDTDFGCGFTYSDYTGLTASIVIDPYATAKTVSFVASPPYVAYVGTKGGIGALDLASSISQLINVVSSYGGPDVSSTSQNYYVFLGENQSYYKSVFETTGTLSSPFELDVSAIGGKFVTETITGDTFTNYVTASIEEMLNNFSKLRTLSSIDRVFEDDKFELSNNRVNFYVSNKLEPKTFQNPRLNTIDSLFNDKKMSHIDNFKYLPPIVKTSDSIAPDKTNIDNLRQYLLGDYPSWGDNESELTINTFSDSMKSFRTPGNSAVIDFVKTSLHNNVIGQFFELAEDKISKLDVVEYGILKNDTYDPARDNDRVFFVGKTFTDDRGSVCFINMFTLTFSNKNGNTK